MQNLLPPAKRPRTINSVNFKEGHEANQQPQTTKNQMNSKVNKMESQKIDLDLYSRQLGSYGIEMMSKLVELNVLIINVKSTGAECAKNLILSGPKSVAVYDNEICEISDVGVNFMIHEQDVQNGRCRSDAIINELQDLNRYVHVYNIKEEPTESTIAKFDVVVICDSKKEDIIKYNNMVRSITTKKIGFLCCNIYGLCGYIFVDFNQDFICYDRNGENPKSCVVGKITNDKEGFVSFDYDKACPLEDDDYVKFENVEGMTEINGKIYKIKNLKRHSFTVGDTTTFGTYKKGGVCMQVKIPLKMHFNSFEEVCKNPLCEKYEMKTIEINGKVYQEVTKSESFLICDFAKCDISNHLHYAVQALQKFEVEVGHLPAMDDVQAFEQIYKYAVELNNKDKEQKLKHSVEEVKKEVIWKTAKYSKAHIAPVASFFGGFLAQEIVKFTGKFMPIYQILYVDFFETVADSNVMAEKEAPTSDQNETTYANCKNSHIISIFGKSFQEKLNRLNVFLVGAGALGCEYAKLFSLLDVCSSTMTKKGEEGCLSVTDNDNIEVSNLNRQFLFRREHVGKSKSKVVREKILSKNPQMVVTAFETKVGTESEHIFNDAFWEKQDVIVNALDNIQARQYIDGKCVWHSKPLMESGTLGTKGNVQVVLPFLTQSYNDSFDPPEDSIPLCTLKHFPYDIIHTIEYARDCFQGLFYNTPLQIQQFLNNKQEYVEKMQVEGNTTSQLEMLQIVVTTLKELSKEKNFDYCIKKAVNVFQLHFINQINQLLYSIPPDHKLSNGDFFWVGQKKTPHPLPLDLNDPLTELFLLSASNLFAEIYNIPHCTDIEYIKKRAATVELNPFTPAKLNVKIDEKNLNNISLTANSEPQMAKDFCNELMEIDTTNIKTSALEFDKDNDENYHVDFVHAFANLRAQNYDIQNCDKLKTKIVAGKIIPALATTTSIITGLVGIEFLKYVYYYDELQKYRKLTPEEKKKEKDVLSYFKNAFTNTALPLLLFSEPLPPQKTVDKDYDEIMKGPIKAIPNGFTSWDKIEITIKNGTIKDFIDYLSKTYNVEVNLVAVGNACLFNSFLPIHNKERLNKPIHELYKSITKTELCNDVNYIVVEASCNDMDQVDVLLPSIKFVYK